MVIVNMMSGNIWYEGIDVEDCQLHMPPTPKGEYRIMTFEEYEEYNKDLDSYFKSIGG